MIQPALYGAMGLMAIVWINCSNLGNHKSEVHKMDSHTVSDHHSNTGDSLISGKAALGAMYTQAIAAYIQTIFQKDQTSFDTLFLGNPTGFPDIDLPTVINGVKIQVLQPETTESYKSRFKKSSPYINVMGFMEDQEVSFIFVTFYPEFKHQYAGYFDFKYNSGKKQFEADQYRIEVLIRNAAGHPDHYAIYKDGQYAGDKPIK